MPKKLESLQGVFGRLSPIHFIRMNKWHQAIWSFSCSCGNIVSLNAAAVKFGRTKSCGCIRKERNNNTSHGLSKTPFHKVWENILTRCNNPKGTAYKWYGARGIKVEWESFQDFKDTMYLSYTTHVSLFGIKNTTIERTNSNGNYSTKNCRWATRQEQRRNTRANIFIKYDEELLCLSDTAKKYNIERKTLTGRLERGWPIKKALTTPVGIYTRNS